MDGRPANKVSYHSYVTRFVHIVWRFEPCTDMLLLWLSYGQMLECEFWQQCAGPTIVSVCWFQCTMQHSPVLSG